MAKADGSIVIDTKLNNDGFTKGVNGMKKQADGLKSAFGKLGSAIASAFAVKALIDFGKEAIELGSNVAEVQNVVDTAFGDMSYKVESFADTAIQNFGMSRLAAKKTASNYMAMAKGMGVAEEAASDMSVTLAGLSGDVASFYNLEQEEAAQKLAGVFTGEGEALKSIGVVMTETNLQAYALSKGITKQMKDMTQAEKVALRYGFVTDSLALAQGDFAKTSDGWANQTRILSMQWEEFMSIVGQTLITVLAPAVKMLNEIVSSLINVATVINSLVTNMFGGEQEAAAAVSKEIDGNVESQEAMTEATEETAKAQKQLLAGFDEINKLGGGKEEDKEEAGLGIDVPAFDVMATSAQEVEKSGLPAFFEKLKAAVEPFRDTFVKALSDIRSGASWIKETFTKVWEDLSSLKSPLKNWFNTDFFEFAKTFVSTFGTVLGGLLDTVGMVFTDLWNIVIFPIIQKWAVDVKPALTRLGTRFLESFSSLFIDIKGAFDTGWKNAWDRVFAIWDTYGAPTFEKVSDAIRGTVDYIKNVWKTIVIPIWENFMSVVDKLWEDHLSPLWENIQGFIAKLIQGALDIYNGFILPMWNWFVDTFGGHIVNAFNDTISKIGDFLGVVVDVASYIIDALKGVIDFVAGVFTGDWERAFEGVKNIFKGIVNGMILIVESFCNYFVRAINKVISAANSLSFDLPDWIPGIGGKTFGLNIPSIKEISLPRLATGAVVPPNREFMAMLGDNKTETEVVSPLSTMKQAMIEALRVSGGTGKPTTIVFEGELAALARVLRPYIEEEGRRVGVSLVTK